MKSVFAFAFSLFLTVAASAQNYVYQSGGVTPNHAVRWITNGVIGDGGTAANGFLSSIGVLAQGPAICQQSAAPPSSYNQLCLGVNTAGAATISLQNYGGASPQNLNFVINGVTYPFPQSLNSLVIGGTAIINCSTNGYGFYNNNGILGCEPAAANVNYVTLEEQNVSPLCTASSGADCTPALNAAVAAMTNGSTPTTILLGSGTYKFSEKPNNFTVGVILSCAGASQTTLDRYYSGGSSTEGFLTWTGVGAIGGGIKNCQVVADDSSSSGVMLKFTNGGNVVTGYGNVENVVVSYVGSSDYNWALYVDGSQNTTSGSQGFRDVRVVNSYFFQGASSTQSIYLNNATNFQGTGIWANGAVTITGGGTSLSNTTNANFNGIVLGTMTVQNTTLLTVSGQVNDLIFQSAVTNSCVSAYIPPGNYSDTGTGNLKGGCSNFTGATSGAAGYPGIVPQPTSGQQGYYLQGSGAWVNAIASGTLNEIPYYPGTGNVLGATTLGLLYSNVVSNVRGSLAEVGASGLQGLNPSATSGLPLLSQGTSADPAYVILGISGGGTGAAISATQYGLPYFSSTTVMGSTVAGTSSQVLQGNASGAPTWLSSSTTVNGTTCTLGSTCTPAASSITIGTTTITSGLANYFLYQSGASPTGVIQEVSSTGTAGSVVLSGSPTLTGTPALGAPTAASIALGGCTIGGNVLCTTGTSSLSGVTSVAAQLNSTAATTVVSAAGATLDDVNIEAETATVTGTTNITTATGFNKVSFYQPVFTDASSATVSLANTLYIANAPSCTGSLTCTKVYSLYTGAGDVWHAGTNEATTFTNQAFSASQNATLVVQRNVTSLSAKAAGLIVDNEINNTTASQGGLGLGVYLSVPSSNSTVQGSLTATQAQIWYAGTGAGSTNLLGSNFTILNTGTGTATSAIGFAATIENTGGGTITLADGIQIATPVGPTSPTSVTWTALNGIEIQNQNPSGTGTNTLTNPPVALLIDSQTATGAFAIKQSGSGLNSFAGASTFSGALNNTGIASTATTSAVCVNTGTGLFSYDSTIGTCNTSDERLKSFDHPINDALLKLVALSRDEHFGYFHAKGNEGKQQFGDAEHIGIGAQTVAKFFPELTATGSDGLMSLAYDKLTVPIIESLAELKADNDNLHAEFERFQREIEGLKAKYELPKKEEPKK